MKIDLNLQKYVDWKVNGIMQIKDAYGYRVKLVYADGNELVQQKSGFQTVKEAENSRMETIGQLYTNTYVVYEKISVKDFYEFWLESVMRPQITNDTYKGYESKIRNHIIPQIGKKKLSTLSRADVQKLYNKVFKKSKSVARVVKVIVGTSMKYALDKKMISYNPAEDVDLPKEKRQKEFRVRHIDEQKTLTYEQVMILVNAAKNTPIYLQVMFAALMGLRRSEIIGLKYTDIDFVNRTLYVKRQLGTVPLSKKEECRAKTYTKQEIGLKTQSSERILPIPNMLFEAIMEEWEIYQKNKARRLKDRTNPFLDEQYICCSSYGKPRCKTFYFSHFKKLLKENNLPDIRWHDLRSTYCTILLKNDFNAKAVSKLMGHAKEIITIDVYGDKKELIGDCLDVLEPFIAEVIPKDSENNTCELINIDEFIEELFDEEEKEVNIVS